MNVVTRDRPGAPVNVIHSIPTWLPQTMTWLYGQVRELPLERIRSHVVCETTSHLDQFPVERLHSLDGQPRWRSLVDRGLRKLRFRRHLGHTVRVARDAGGQVLHSHFGNVGWANLGAVGKMRHVVTFYGYDVNHLPLSNPRWRARYAELFEQLDLVLCEGPHMARCIVDLGCPEDRVEVHHLGVEVDRIPFRPLRYRAGEPLRVLMAATFREKKGLTYAIEALGRLRREVPLEVTLIGDATPEERSRQEKARIDIAIRDQGLSDVIRRPGFRPYAELLDEAYRHHVFLSPSVTASDGDTEGGAPVSLIEMAAAGVAIVATTHCDIPEVVQNGVGGRLAPERDVDGIVERLLQLARTPDDWEPMLRAARARVETEFCSRRQALTLAGRYEALVQGRRHDG